MQTVKRGMCMTNQPMKHAVHGAFEIARGLMITLRPRQWTKNLILFAGILFSNNLLHWQLLRSSVLGFVIFCFLSGSVYILNDIIDIEKDKAHHKKSKRPIASGQVKVGQALMFFVLLLIGSLTASFYISFYFGLIGLGYVLLVVLYSFGLKNVVILDIMAISSGFVLRAAAGAVLVGVRISPWLILCTLLLSMFLALHKRRSELRVFAGGAVPSRRVLEEYTPELIEDMLHIVTSSTLMAYSLYTFTGSHSIYMMGTIPFVIYGIFRYQYIAHTRDMGESPELVLLSDKPLIVNILLWVASCILILYFL